MRKIFLILFLLLLCPSLAAAYSMDSADKEEIKAAKNAKCNIRDAYNAFAALPDNVASGENLSCNCTATEINRPVAKRTFLFGKMGEKNIFFSNYEGGEASVTISSDGKNCIIQNNCYDPGGFGVSQFSFSCSAPVPAHCCCRDVGSGELTKNRECSKITEQICNGITFGDGAEGDYQSFQLDTSGGCSAYVKNEAEYKGTASGSSIGDLKKEAAEALNQMKFKTGTAGINDLIGRAISFLTMAIGSLLLLFYVYAGILWMTAMGNSERTGKAKQIVVWSTLGVIVVLASYAIIKFVFSVVG